MTVLAQDLNLFSKKSKTRFLNFLEDSNPSCLKYLRRNFILPYQFWHFKDDVYITKLFIYQKIFIMQKTALSTPPKERNIKYFKYEMKDTNQLLRDLISCNMSQTLSRSAQKKQQANSQDMFKQIECESKIQNGTSLETKKKNQGKKLIDLEFNMKQTQKPFLKYQDQHQNCQSLMFKDHLMESVPEKRKKTESPMQDLILQKIFIDFSDNQDSEQNQRPSFQKYKSKDLEFNGNEKYDQNRQIKKQKKGLANISLRVKNIVSQHKKLTYKQVSDLVLQYSKDQINQLSQSQKIREIKNIKRRVYDALNVLVAVGILGKHQRCVCITQWTNVPGKKLSTQWQKINSKIQYITKLKKNCAQKSQALKFLIDKYNAILALRRKHQEQDTYYINEEKSHSHFENMNQEKISINNLSATQKQEIDKNQQKIKKQQAKTNINKKLMFPVIVFCPAFDQNPHDKLTVQMQYEETNIEEDNNIRRQKVKISGKDITILGDFDCALQLNLEKYRDHEKEQKLLQEIQRHGSQIVRKKMVNFKHSSHEYEQNIEDYFNQQMFQSD